MALACVFGYTYERARKASINFGCDILVYWSNISQVWCHLPIDNSSTPNHWAPLKPVHYVSQAIDDPITNVGERVLSLSLGWMLKQLQTRWSVVVHHDRIDRQTHSSHPFNIFLLGCPPVEVKFDQLTDVFARLRNLTAVNGPPIRPKRATIIQRGFDPLLRLPKHRVAQDRPTTQLMSNHLPFNYPTPPGGYRHISAERPEHLKGFGQRSKLRRPRFLEDDIPNKELFPVEGNSSPSVGPSHSISSFSISSRYEL